jgi:hypothetical protein
MRLALFSTLTGFPVLTASSALAQATAPGAIAPGATPIGESGMGAAEWLWLVILVALAAAAFSYFARGRRPNT